MEAVTTMLSNAVTVFGSCWDAMTSNVPIAILVGLSLLGSGAGLFAKFRHAVYAKPFT